MHVMMHVICSCCGFSDVHVGMHFFCLYLMKFSISEGGLVCMLMIDTTFILVRMLCMNKTNDNPLC